MSHRDGQPHVHVIANRVDPESGKAAGLNRSQLKLSKWAEEYERGRGEFRCPQRERNNRQRSRGERVVDGRGHSGGRWRRERMNPQQEREAIPAGRDGWGGPERERVAWQRAEEHTHSARFEQERGKALGELERRSKREWSALYGRQERQREQLGKDCRGVLGRFRLWRELGGGVREISGAVRGRPEVLEGFRAELEDRLRWERVSLGKAHSEAVRGIEREAGAAYRGGMEGSQERAELAARTGGMAAHYDPPIDGRELRRSVMQERMEQMREVDGEQAYEKMVRAVERASQRRLASSQSPSRDRPERRGPERGGPERILDRAASLVLLRERERMGRTDWEEA